MDTIKQRPGVKRLQHSRRTVLFPKIDTDVDKHPTRKDPLAGIRHRQATKTNSLARIIHLKMGDCPAVNPRLFECSGARRVSRRSIAAGNKRQIAPLPTECNQASTVMCSNPAIVNQSLSSNNCDAIVGSVVKPIDTSRKRQTIPVPQQSYQSLATRYSKRFITNIVYSSDECDALVISAKQIFAHADGQKKSTLRSILNLQAVLDVLRVTTSLNELDNTCINYYTQIRRYLLDNSNFLQKHSQKYENQILLILTSLLLEFVHQKFFISMQFRSPDNHQLLKTLLNLSIAARKNAKVQDGNVDKFFNKINDTVKFTLTEDSPVLDMIIYIDEALMALEALVNPGH